MRVAAIYDIHGNLPALEAVLADIARDDVDRIVVAGDHPTPFPEPGREVLRREAVQLGRFASTAVGARALVLEGLLEQRLAPRPPRPTRRQITGFRWTSAPSNASCPLNGNCTTKSTWLVL
jgi:hypothetical protein